VEQPSAREALDVGEGVPALDRAELHSAAEDPQEVVGAPVQVQVQAHPGVCTVSQPGAWLQRFQRLKLQHDELLSDVACFGFNFSLRPYEVGQDQPQHAGAPHAAQVLGRAAVQVDPALTPD